MMCKSVAYLIRLVLVSGFILTSVAEAAEPGLIGWWKLDEGSGTIALDSSGNGVNGAFTGDPEWVDGIMGGALAFDGDGDGVDTGYTQNLVNFTAACWVISPAAPAGDADRAGPVERQFNFMMCWDRTEDTFRGAAIANIGGKWHAAKYGPLEADTWYHLATTYDGEEFKAYRNGQLITNNTVPSGAPRAESRTLKIGRGLAAFFTGTVDDVQVYNRALTEAEIQKIMAKPLPQASSPNPPDGQEDVSRDVHLAWKAVESAGTRDVYFGTVLEDVQNADRTNPLGVLASQGQDANSYTPTEPLAWEQTYYWRVDEVNSTPDSTAFKGNVWQFTVEPFAYPIAGVKATASSAEATMGPENTVNNSGLTSEQHSTLDTAMWLSAGGADMTLPAWIQYEFPRLCKLQEMQVWNSNQKLEKTFGFGAKDVKIEYSPDGVTWTLLRDQQFKQAAANDTYEGEPIPFDGVSAKFVRLTINSNWGGVFQQVGLSEVRFLYIPVWATQPNPPSGATAVSIGTIGQPADVGLGFRAGREAVEHDVHLSTDRQAVVDGTAYVATVTEPGYGPLPLDLGATYYWRVDEANDVETPAKWAGDIWDFTTQEFFVVDDFEDYNDTEPDRIFDTWSDGWDIPENGSQVGNGESPFAEQTIVHEGDQAMPFFYDNTTADHSIATLTLASGRDWTVRGVGALSLWFRGRYLASVGSFTEDAAGAYTMTASGADIGGVSDEFHFAYKELSTPGSIIAKVESVSATDNWAKAGVMIRDTLDANAVHAMVVVTPSQGVSFERRWTVAEGPKVATQTGITAPQWVKIQRDLSGYVTASYSSDGSSWTEIGAELIWMSNPVYIGLAVTAHNTQAVCEAKFSNVQITGTVGSQWSHQYIGTLGNDPEPLYVALSNKGKTPVAVYHPDPNATQVGEWTEWTINLDQFKGVNLADVDKLSIGVDNKAGPQGGSSGVMYIDDIRLRPPVIEAPPQDPDLVAYYKLDQDAKDSSPNGYHGTVQGDPQWVSGAIGGALQFDGVDDGVDTGYTENLANFTVAFWAKSPAAPGTSSTGSGPVERQYNFMMTWDRPEDEFREAIMAHIGGWKAAKYGPLEADTWYHLAATYDGDTLNAYRNGQLITSNAAPSGPPRAESRTLKIGRGLTTFFSGTVDDVRIYRRALTEAEIAGLADVIAP